MTAVCTAPIAAEDYYYPTLPRRACRASCFHSSACSKDEGKQQRNTQANRRVWRSSY
jgi:hypothetical protein